MKKLLVVLSFLMTFVSFVSIPDFLPRKVSYATLCQTDRGPENAQRFVSDFDLALRIAIWFILAQTLIVSALAYVTRTKPGTAQATSEPGKSESE